MQKAKTFLFVSTGVFLLALAYAFGASTARAEFANGLGIYFGHFNQRAMVAWANGRVWVNGGSLGDWQETAPVPQENGSIALFTGQHVMTTTGRVYEFEQSFWQDLGTAPLLATPVQQSTWGSVKARWR